MPKNGSFWKPGGVYENITDFLNPCSELGQNHRFEREAMGLTTDFMIKNIIDELKEQNMYENTLIIISSDNGGLPGALAANTPLRGGKNTNFEGGIRVRAAMTGGALPPSLRGKTFKPFIHISDWFPTFSYLAGAKNYTHDEVYRNLAQSRGIDSSIVNKYDIHGKNVAPLFRRAFTDRLDSLPISDSERIINIYNLKLEEQSLLVINKTHIFKVFGYKEQPLADTNPFGIYYYLGKGEKNNCEEENTVCNYCVEEVCALSDTPDPLNPMIFDVTNGIENSTTRILNKNEIPSYSWDQWPRENEIRDTLYYPLPDNSKYKYVTKPGNYYYENIGNALDKAEKCTARSNIGGSYVSGPLDYDVQIDLISSQNLIVPPTSPGALPPSTPPIIQGKFLFIIVGGVSCLVIVFDRFFYFKQVQNMIQILKFYLLSIWNGK